MPFFDFDAENIRTFIELAKGMIRLNQIILCEGIEDRGDLNALVGKLGVVVPIGTGVICCGGIDPLQEFAGYIAALAHVSKRLRTILLVIDSDMKTPDQRVQSLVQSLECRNIEIRDLQLVSGSIYRARACSSPGSLGLVIKIAGDMRLPFTTHEREDYAVQLLILNGEITLTDLTGFVKSSDFLNNRNRKSYTIILNSTEDNVRHAYENIVNFLLML
jgi:hypothetical protein